MSYYQDKNIYFFVCLIVILPFFTPSVFAKEPGVLEKTTEDNREEALKRELSRSEFLVRLKKIEKELDKLEKERKEKIILVQEPERVISEPEPKKRKLPVQISGYYKNLLISSKTLAAEESFFSDSQRLRLKFKADLGPKWQAVLVYDNDLILNDFADTADFDLVRDKNQDSLAFWDADKVLADKRHVYAKHSLYRAYLKYYSPAFQFVLGKQKIDWGRVRFYSPMDLFNPLSPLDIEAEERIGVDAANLEFSLGQYSGLNLVYAPRDNLEKSRMGLRFYRAFGNYDTFLIAGEFAKDKVIGAGFDGYIGDAGFRGEFTCTEADNGRNYFRGTIGAEYDFPNKVHLLGEYFYNGGAEDNDSASFTGSYEFAGRVLTQKKHLLGVWAGYEITPLLKWDNYGIYDLDEESIFVCPELKYNIVTNLDLSLGAQLFFGNANSEFGNYQHIYYFQTQYFF